MKLSTVLYFPVVLILLFYTANLDFIFGSLLFAPYLYQFATLMVALAILFLQSDGLVFRLNKGNALILIWMFYVFIVSMFSIVIKSGVVYSDGAFRTLLGSTSAVISIYVCLLLIRNCDNSKLLNTFFALYLLSCLLIIIDPIIDLRQYFKSISINDYELSRAGGYYFQPNIAATAICFYFAFLISRVNTVNRYLISLFGFIAVFLTFSRSGILLFCILLLFALHKKYLNKFIVVNISIVIICILFFIAANIDINVGDIYSYIFGLDEGSGVLRVNDFFDFFGYTSITTDSRVEIAKNTINYIENNFVFGNGFGFSWFWSEYQAYGQGTHNIYLRYMLEFGVFGFVIWLLFVFALYVSRYPNIDKSSSIVVTFSAIYVGFFSHNLPEQISILCPLMCAYIFPTTNNSVN